MTMLSQSEMHATVSRHVTGMCRDTPMCETEDRQAAAAILRVRRHLHAAQFVNAVFAVLELKAKACLGQCLGILT